jgi:hypothetical protein
MLDDLDITIHYDHAGSAYHRPKHLKSLNASVADHYERVLVLLRDPRDTVVSAFHHVTKRAPNYDGSLSEFIRDPCRGIAKIVRFHQIWRAAASRREGVAIVTYEKLHSDPEQTLAFAAAFFGYTPTADRIAEVVTQNRFVLMQSRERSGVYAPTYGGLLSPRNVDDINTYKVRKGRVGSYLEELSAEDIAYCNAILEEGLFWSR